MVTTTRKLNCKTLPKYLVELIALRKKALSKKRKSNNKKTRVYGDIDENKKIYNKLTNIIRDEVKSIQEKIWNKFCENIDRIKPNSSEYWKKIKQISKLENKSKAKSIPELYDGEKKLTTPLQKADLFGKI